MAHALHKQTKWNRFTEGPVAVSTFTKATYSPPPTLFLSLSMGASKTQGCTLPGRRHEIDVVEAAERFSDTRRLGART